MASKTDRSPDAQRETLQYMLMLRQLEAESKALRSSFERLSDAVAAQRDKDLPTVLLDWLEVELNPAEPQGDDIGAQLLEQTVRLARALKR